ncbi:hypothetical protein BUALT_Bualt03G0106500 [Buddleja alternifolia]|uniref:Pectinesterase catalytic domain-containing protein n=1 Tax=Buddleja alternifolia TaxID=168488 RepID=A0AAV6Y023_9LAMI|nr:hypothetical protein BUALT_Bualt03G0106500 [Buddleja alternifolia]
MEYQKTSKSSNTPQQLKKMIPQLLLSLSIFSFLFSYSSSSVYSPKPHYFSANYFQPLSFALNKNCIFLIFNGLLVFLAKTSGFVRPPSSLDLNDILQKPIGDGMQTTIAPKDEKLASDETACNPEDEEEDQKEIDRCSSTETPKEVSIFIADSEEEGGGACCDLEDVKKDEISQAESRKCWLFDDEEEQELYREEVEEEDKGETEMLSTEELNQKFEDFIRRVKEEIMINEDRQKHLAKDLWQRTSFENSAGPGSQAVALLSDVSSLAFFRCIFLGFQDTLYSKSGRHFYRECYICVASDMQLRKEEFVAYLGRPWFEYSTVVIMECYIDDIITPVGWGEWPPKPLYRVQE